MLRITLPGKEFYNEKTEEFHTTKAVTLILEHSLLSVSKWESLTHRCFIDPFKDLTEDDLKLYIRCMVVSPKEVDPYIFYGIPSNIIKGIVNYIQDEMTGTTFSEKEQKRHVRPRKMSSEEIYWEMTEFGIPFECEKWHLNRLLTLIRICGIKNTQPKKSGKKGRENAAVERAKINAARRTGSRR